MKIQERLRQIREERGMTQEEMARLLGYKSRSSVNKLETGEREISQSMVLDFAKSLGVSPAYLMGWEGKNQEITESYLIPVYSSVSAGYPLLTNDEVIDYEEIPEHWQMQGEFFGLKISGDSMIPDFKDGDILIVKKQNNITNGDLAIVMVNGEEATFKKVQRTEEGIFLIPLNTSIYSPKFFTNEDIERLPVTIIGTAIEVRRKL